MMNPALKRGRQEFRSAFWSAKGLFVVAAVMSFFVNLLMLTGPLFMLQVYDRVLASGSLPTLQALFVLVAGLFIVMGLLDFLRGRVLANAGARFQALLDGRAFEATMQTALVPDERSKPATALRDLESIQQFLSGPAPYSFFDAPWTPIYVAVIFVLHPMLGWFSVGAAILLFTIAFLNQSMTIKPEIESRQATATAEKFSESVRREAEAVRALGMIETTKAQWGKQRGEALVAQMTHSGRAGFFQAMSKSLRLFLQSAILAVGAYLAVKNEISPGVMIAGSILMGRALAPIDQAIAQWRMFIRARQASRSLEQFFATTPVTQPKTALPDPDARLTVENIAVSPPGTRQPIVRGVSFDVKPGEAVGVIGPSASGKSTLARALVGIWPALAGEIRLDGATLDQWSEADFGRLIGYLPQDVGLFTGSVARNIARLQEDADPRGIVLAAERAGAHEMILKLPNGYDTEIGEGGAQLSGGQRQRIGLARALFGDPPLLVFDEPNANLDAEGEQSLIHAIRQAKERGRAVIVMAHRPSAIAVCDRLLVMRDGAPVAFGPRDEVLKQTTTSHGQITELNRSASGSVS